MRNVRLEKIIGAFLSCAFFELVFISCLISIFVAQFNEEEQMPWFLFWIMVIMFFVPCIAIVLNFISRLREIKGGEEDEASKY